MDWKNALMHAHDGHARGHALALAKAREIGLPFEPDESLSAAHLFQVRATVGREIYANGASSVWLVKA